jgi:hypothetical protein
MDLSTLSHEQIVAISIAVLWEFIWKAFALWRAGRNNHPVWFIIMLFLNTLGILPIIYLLTHRRHDAATEPNA